MDKAAAITSAIGDATGATNIQAVPDHDGSAVDMIVNTTSLGLHNGDALPLPLDAVDESTLIADIIMSPAETAWLQAAHQRGLPVHYGRHMLDCQIEIMGRFIGAL